MESALKVNGSSLAPERSILPRRIEFVKASTGSASAHGAGEEDAAMEGPKPAYYLYPRDRVSDLLHAAPQNRRVGRGLQNAGNTCFVNSVLQTLLYTAPLQRYLLSEEHPSTESTGEFCAISIFRKHAAEVLDEGSRSAVVPKAILKRLKEFGGRKIQLGRQEDAHEFLRHFLDACHRSLLNSAPQGANAPLVIQHTTLIYQLFGGYLRSGVTCLECRKESSTFDPFLDLSLEVHNSSTLEKALEFFTKSDKICGPTKYQCKRCKKHVDATKRFTIHALPPVLSFQLKRFEFAQKTRGKILKQVSFPVLLDVARFTNHPERAAQYRLYAVIVHDGHSARSGHYFAFARHGGTWYEFNDETVRPVSEQQVLRQQAYLLFYESTSPKPKHVDTQMATNIVNDATLPTAANGGKLATPPIAASEGEDASTPSAKNGASGGKDASTLSATNGDSGGKDATNLAAKNAAEDSSAPLHTNGVVSTLSAANVAKDISTSKVLHLPFHCKKLRRLLALSRIHSSRRPNKSARNGTTEDLVASTKVQVCEEKSLRKRKRTSVEGSVSDAISPHHTAVAQADALTLKKRSTQAKELLDDAKGGEDVDFKPAEKRVSKPQQREAVEQTPETRSSLAGSYSTQFGLAEVDRWDDEDAISETEKAAFAKAQQQLQPPVERRDELDAEYDVGKKKHKPKKEKAIFTGKTAFDLEAARRAQPKGKGSGKGGKSKGKGKGKGKDKGKGKGKGKSKGKKAF